MGPADRESSEGVLVLGLGNVLMGDAAFGPHVIRRLLAAYRFDRGVRAVDAATAGSDIRSLIAGAAALIVVDTVTDEGAPGELRLYRREEILARALIRGATAHQSWLREILLTIGIRGAGPTDVLLVGVTPCTIAPRARLSPAVRGALWRAEVEVIRELIRLGRRPQLAWPPKQPDIWWERPVPPDRRKEPVR